LRRVAAAIMACMIVAVPAIAQEAAPSTPPPEAVAPADNSIVPVQPPVQETPENAPEQSAPDPAPEAVAVEEAELPHDLSPWGMFMAADLVVKAVMIGLAFASLVTWTVGVAKSLELLGAKARIRRALGRIVESRTLADASAALGKAKGPAALLVRAADHETRLSEESVDHGGAAGLKERVTSHLARIEAQAARRMTRGTGVLATIGSTAPFVGLFGTVWGIMNAFIGISESQTTNLAVVAPGIAEALLATGIGLVAAIPAVVIYNVFARSIAGYRLILADASAAVERLVSRDIDRRAVPASLPLAAE
jgi:biopolymer transport protein ExbB